VWSPQLEQERRDINHWMTTSPLPDGVIDEQVLGDPANPSTLLAAYDSGDGLHPNDAGHAALGNHIDLPLLPTP
jgi:lysophospholipase L1-like esterase